MQIYTRYRLPPARGRFRRVVYWLLAAAALAFLVWIFAATARREPTPRRTVPIPPPAPATSAPPVRPVLPTMPAPGPAPGQPTSAPVVISIPPATAVPPFGPTNLVAPGVWTGPRPPETMFETQLALARQGISSGSMDGAGGAQTRSALAAFQERDGLARTGRPDRSTLARLRLDEAPLTRWVVTTNDLARLLPVSPTWLGKSHQVRLDYESVLELVSEQTWSHPNLLRRLNPGVDWTTVMPGTSLVVPNVAVPPAFRVAEIRIRLAGRVLEAYDAAGRLRYHYPCSIARRVEMRPVGRLTVVTVVPNPDYTFNPEVFPESAEARRLTQKLPIPPGPNNPVGVAWIGLDRAGYGIHGTPRPEDVGRTESHGCFRLANWNAAQLARAVAVGTPVSVEP